MTPEETEIAVTDLKIEIKLEGQDFQKIELLSEEKKYFLSMLLNFFKNGIQLIPDPAPPPAGQEWKEKAKVFADKEADRQQKENEQEFQDVSYWSGLFNGYQAGINELLENVVVPLQAQLQQPNPTAADYFERGRGSVEPGSPAEVKE